MCRIVGNSQNHQQEKEPGHRNLLHLSPPLTPGARILWDFTAAGRVGIPGRNTGISGIALEAVKKSTAVPRYELLREARRR
jgi:hypothetical protein